MKYVFNIRLAGLWLPTVDRRRLRTAYYLYWVLLNYKMVHFAFIRHLHAVFEKTCEATQENVKSHVFGFWKKNVKERKNVHVGLLNL